MALLLSDFHNTPDESVSTAPEEAKVFVAVGGGANESTLTLCWAIQRFSGRNFCILHVHRPSMQAQRDMETTIISNKLDEYVLICNKSGIQAEKVYMEMDSIEKGILELISQHKIHNLIMGAAADQNYDVKMLEPKSSKAIYVKSHAPPYCHIWFICRGNLVSTREARFDSPGPGSVNAREITMTPQATLNSEGDCQANILESICREELHKRMEIEAELELLKIQYEKTLAEAANQELVITNYERTIKELEEGAGLYAELVKFCEQERDEAVKLCSELTESAVDLSSETNSPDYFLTLPSSEILKAASESADQSSQLLCEGELGNIYKAILYHTEVTLRFLPEDEFIVFQHEVKLLSKFHHPNIATLIGASPETLALVYEPLPNGSLEDRLRCKGNTHPLSWKTRIRIAVELCSALIFLHSHGVIHGALRPSCILLDSNLTCKIIDFRYSHMGLTVNSSSPASIYIGEYTDPEFIDTRETCTSSDVYSFGLILLELITGRPGFCVVEDVRSCLDQGTLDSFLDTSAGDWSFLQVEQLAHLGLRCCNTNSWERPDLKSGVWKALEPMRQSNGSAVSFRVDEAPPYFVCPIIQEVMEDPHIAADGYTYEAEALKQWLDRGNASSPMTNLPLEHTRLVPNRALRSAIQEWMQLQRR